MCFGKGVVEFQCPGHRSFGFGEHLIRPCIRVERKHAVVVGERGIGRSIEWIAVQGLLEILPGFPEVLKTALAPVIAATEIGIVRIGVHGTRFLQTRFSSWAVSLTRLSPATDRATWL